MDCLVDMMVCRRIQIRFCRRRLIQESASSGALCALVAARERATDFASNRHGGNGRLTAYASTQAHSSIEKAIKLAGIGGENLRLIPIDAQYAMRPDALADAIRQDREKGLTPFFVAATVGTTSMNGMDPLPEIGRICQAEGLWLHVDGAMAGSATVCPEFRRFIIGLDSADSYCFNPHKWLFTNFDCDCFFVRDRAALIQALTILPEYLRTRPPIRRSSIIAIAGVVGPPLSCAETLVIIRHYGVESNITSAGIPLEQEFAGWVNGEAFELMAARRPDLVSFACGLTRLIKLCGPPSEPYLYLTYTSSTTGLVRDSALDKLIRNSVIVTGVGIDLDFCPRSAELVLGGGSHCSGHQRREHREPPTAISDEGRGKFLKGSAMPSVKCSGFTFFCQAAIRRSPSRFTLCG